MKRLLILSVVSLTILACGIAPAAIYATPQPTDATVTIMTVCNTGGLGLVLRSGPSTEYEPKGELPDGTAVTLLEPVTAEFVAVVGGYVSAEYLCNVE